MRNKYLNNVTQHRELVIKYKLIPYLIWIENHSVDNHQECNDISTLLKNE